MFRDAHGLEISCSSQAACEAYDHVIDGYVRNRNDVSQRLKACLEIDPEFGLAHLMRGCLTMSAYDVANLGYVRKCLADAQKLSASANRRERAHVSALEYWVAGDTDRTMAIWEDIARDWPCDIFAFRMHHFLGFWLGRPETMMANVEHVLPSWSRALPAFGAVLACRAFAHEECGSYVVAEHCGRAALEIDAGDIWATHAIAHVYEMQGRRGEGINLLRALEVHWEGGNNLLHHLWWHQALYHFDRGEPDAVLALYDHKFRDLAAPLTAQMPDLYIDVQNAVSMLYRLQLAGVDVGRRWEELAEKAQARGGDGSSPFTLPHWMLALTRTDRFDAAETLIKEAKNFAAAAHAATARPLQQAALPVCEAILAAARGQPGQALDFMRPVMGVLHCLGGSHAQQDLLELFFAATARQANSPDDLQLILERVQSKRPAPMGARTAWRDLVSA